MLAQAKSQSFAYRGPAMGRAQVGLNLRGLSPSYSHSHSPSGFEWSASDLTSSRPNVRSYAMWGGRKNTRNAKRKTAEDKTRTNNMIIASKIQKAVRHHGADPASNRDLKYLLDGAKRLNVSKEVVDRNIKKATEGSSKSAVEHLYEVTVPGGVGIVLETLTDNTKRTKMDIEIAIKKPGGKLVDKGFLTNYKFMHRGSIRVNEPDEEKVFDSASDAGALDILAVDTENSESDGTFEVLTEMADYKKVLDALRDAEIPILMEHSHLVWMPREGTEVELDDKKHETLTKIMENLDEVVEVETVYTNEKIDS